MAPSARWRRDVAAGLVAVVPSAVAAAVSHLLATTGPGWSRGVTLPDMDPPFDLGWLSTFFAWTAGHAGPALLWVFAATVVLLPVVAVLTKGFSAGPAVVGRVVVAARVVPAIALVAVPAFVVAWFLLTQIAFLVAPWLGMYHGEVTPAVP